MMPGGGYTKEFSQALARLSRRKIGAVYSGHDEPFTEGAGDMIKIALKNVRSEERDVKEIKM
jgi:hypothetical protein